MRKEDLRLLVKSIVVENTTRIENLAGVDIYTALGENITYTDAFTKFNYFISNIETIVNKCYDNFLEHTDKYRQGLSKYDIFDALKNRFGDMLICLVTVHLTILTYEKCINEDIYYDTRYTKFCENNNKGIDIRNSINDELPNSLFGGSEVIYERFDDIASILFPHKDDIRNNVVRQGIIYLTNKFFNYKEDGVNMAADYILKYLETLPNIHFLMESIGFNRIRDFIFDGDIDEFNTVFHYLNVKLLNNKKFKMYKEAIDEITDNLSYDNSFISSTLKIFATDDSIYHTDDGTFLLNEEDVLQGDKNKFLLTAFENTYNKINAELKARNLKPCDTNVSSDVDEVDNALSDYLKASGQMLMKAIISFVSNSEVNQEERRNNMNNEMVMKIEEVIKRALNDKKDDNEPPKAKKTKLF